MKGFDSKLSQNAYEMYELAMFLEEDEVKKGTI